jgi:hypothetical protein
MSGSLRKLFSGVGGKTTHTVASDVKFIIIVHQSNSTLVLCVMSAHSIRLRLPLLCSPLQNQLYRKKT